MTSQPFGHGRFRAFCVLILAAFVACSRNGGDTGGTSLPTAEVAAVQNAVTAAEAQRQNAVAVNVEIAKLGNSPKTFTVLQQLNYIAKIKGGYAFTSVAGTASTPCGNGCATFTLFSDAFAGIQKRHTEQPGANAGGRFYTVDLRVTPSTTLGHALANAGALGCNAMTGDEQTVADAPFDTPAVWYAPLDAKPAPAQQVLPSGCPYLR